MKTYDSVDIITVAKVGTATFLKSIAPFHPTSYTHSLLELKRALDSQSNKLIITGMRDPIARNLSYFFQTHKDNFLNGVKTLANNYKGEYCYMPDAVGCGDPHKMIELFFKSKYLYTFNDWWAEFFNITEISNQRFDKDKGLSFFNLKNNNTLLLYTLENLNDNIPRIASHLDIPRAKWRSSNLAKRRPYNLLYKEVQQNIKYPIAYLNKLLRTDAMTYFYTDNFTRSLFHKYNGV